MTLLSRYQLQYTVVDADGRGAQPLTLSVTFVEKAVVTASLLFMGHALSPGAAQSQIEMLNSSNTRFSKAFSNATASALQSWLASATATYVQQMTSSLGTNAGMVAAVNTLRLGLFSSVTQADVTVLDVGINETLSAAANFNSSSLVQKYVYNVTLQVVVLTADMLLSVFVDVLNSTYVRRRLLSSSQTTTAFPVQPVASAYSLVDTTSTNDQAQQISLDSATRSSLMLTAYSDPWSEGMHDGQRQMETMHDGHKPMKNMHDRHRPMENMHDGHRSMENMHDPASAAVGQSQLSADLSQQQSGVASLLHLRSLLAASNSTAFPLASLLQFKTELVLSAFFRTSGCDADSLADLFYDGSAVPSAIDELCGASSSFSALAWDRTLQAAANESIPLLQVCGQMHCLIVMIMLLVILTMCNAHMTVLSSCDLTSGATVLAAGGCSLDCSVHHSANSNDTLSSCVVYPMRYT